MSLRYLLSCLIAVGIVVSIQNRSLANPDDLLDQAIEENKGENKSPEDIIKEGDRLYTSDQFAEAVRMYERAYRLDPRNRSYYARLLEAKKAAGILTATEREALDLLEEERRASIAGILRDVRLGILQASDALTTGDYDLAESIVATSESKLNELPPNVDAAPYWKKLSALRKGLAARRSRLPQQPQTAANDDKPSRDDEPLWLSDSGEMTDTNNATASNSSASTTGEIIDVGATLDATEQRLRYEADVYNATLMARANVLLTAAEAALPPAPDGQMTFPQDWPERTARRDRYRNGIIYRTPDFTGPDGQTYYTAIYDLGDLVHPVPNFYADYPGTSRRQRIENDDRFWLQTRSQIFNGYADDLAAGLPLLHFFGGINHDAVSTRTDPQETQRILRVIDRFLQSSQPVEPN